MPLSRINTPSQSPTCSRCFRTDASGHIPLRRDWPAIFRALRQVGKVALQSRHTYARLIHLGPVPEIVWDEDGTDGRDEQGCLRLHTGLWGTTRGRISLCPCCDSPGYIDILNLRGGDILQFCAAVDTSPAAWAACLEDLVEDISPSASARREVGFPLASADLQPLEEPVDTLLPLLTALGHEQVPLRFVLRTPEVAHTREFVPRRVTVVYPLLNATDGRTTLQVALPPVRRMAAAPDLSLHLLGPGDTLLLSIASPEDHLESWRAAIIAAFPGIDPSFFNA